MKSKILFSSLIAAFAILLLILIFPQQSPAQLVGPVVSMSGNVFNEITREPVTVFLVVLDESGQRVNATRSNAAENGYYYITGLKPGKKYFISMAQKGFFREKFEVSVANTSKYEEISRDFLVKPLEKNTSIKIQVTPFELNKSKLRYGSDFLLNDFKNTLLNNPEVKFEIICYPDNSNDQTANQTLTDERANALKEFFISKGIDAIRFTAHGSGTVDTKNPPPTKKAAKGKRYIGPTYIVVKEF
jgi:OmpA-OmpF porin, OOP family